MQWYKTPKNRFFDALIYAAVGILGLITLLPFLYVIMVSLIPIADYNQFGVTIPRRITFDNYKQILLWGTAIRDAYVITILVTVLGTLLATLTTAMMSYAISHKDLPGRRAFNGMLVFTMFFSGGMIPTYLVVKSLGLLNSIWALILPLSYSAWNALIMRTFFKDIPDALIEAAHIDGASDVTIAFRIVFPLSKPVFATVALFFAVAYWNDWWQAKLYISDAKLYPLQMALYDVINANARLMDPMSELAQSGKDAMPSDIIRMTAIIITTLPILVVYPFVQKYFIKGVMVGSIKG